MGFLLGLIPLMIFTVPLVGFPRQMSAAVEVSRAKEEMGIRYSTSHSRDNISLITSKIQTPNSSKQSDHLLIKV